MPFVVIIIMAHHLNYGDEKCKAPGRLVVTFI